MPEKEVAVTFLPMGKTVYVLEETRLLEAAAVAGAMIDQPCGGEGTCGKCRILVSEGACEPTLVDDDTFSPKEIQQGWRLACQAVVIGPSTVEIPESSLLEARHQILVHTENGAPAVADPAIRKQFVELSPPERGDDAADLIRLEKIVGPIDADLDVLRLLPGWLRENHFRGTAVASEGNLIDFEPGNTESECFAVAVDVGTTTLAAMLLDLNTGAERAVVSRLNPQTTFGEDVLARIRHARENAGGLHELHERIVEAIDAMVGELAAEAGVGRERIYELVVAGNTTMQQMLCRIDPSSLGESPFAPTTTRRVDVAASKLGLQLHPRARVYVLPSIGGFVGGDIVAGILATGLADGPGPTLLVDIGTNGEIVLFADGKLTAASTAAGPAFEGARISQGMRGCAGAIEKVVLDGHPRINVIGNVAPVGLCGSALVDLAAELLRHGILGADGRLRVGDELSGDMTPDLRRRVVVHDGQPAFLLATEAETGIDRPILVTQRDFRELQLATGAIRAGVVILLRRAGLRPADLDRVLIAGAFGNFIRRSNAQRLGLLPHEIPRNRIRFQGNTSLAGARLAALSQTARRQAERLATRTGHVDLSHDIEFQEAFAEAMVFPTET